MRNLSENKIREITVAFKSLEFVEHSPAFEKVSTWSKIPDAAANEPSPLIEIDALFVDASIFTAVETGRLPNCDSKTAVEKAAFNLLTDEKKLVI